MKTPNIPGDVRINNFLVGGDNPYHIGNGVIYEIAEVFDHKLTPQPNVDNLRQFIGKVGQAKTLQDNINTARDQLDVQGDAVAIARDWVLRSGLMTRVVREFSGQNPEFPGAWDPPEFIGGGYTDAMVITGGIRNWMRRRACVVQDFPKNSGRIPDNVLLVGGNRPMSIKEGPDVEEGMTEADYLKSVIKPQLKKTGLDAQFLRVNSSDGNEVMLAAAKKLSRLVDVKDDYTQIVVAANAGNWPQNAGQLTRAIWEVVAPYDRMCRVGVITDEFPLGNGTELPVDAQNPFSALGQLARNVQEFAQHPRY